jgi:hypothetical protein
MPRRAVIGRFTYRNGDRTGLNDSGVDTATVNAIARPDAAAAPSGSDASRVERAAIARS